MAMHKESCIRCASCWQQFVFAPMSAKPFSLYSQYMLTKLNQHVHVLSVSLDPRWVDLLCVYQAVHGPLIPLVPLDAFVLHSLLQLVKNVVLVFAFVFSHEAGKLLLQCLPGNLMGGKVYWRNKAQINIRPFLDWIFLGSLCHSSWTEYKW